MPSLASAPAVLLTSHVATMTSPPAAFQGHGLPLKLRVSEGLLHLKHAIREPRILGEFNERVPTLRAQNSAKTNVQNLTSLSLAVVGGNIAGSVLDYSFVDLSPAGWGERTLQVHISYLPYQNWKKLTPDYASVQSVQAIDPHCAKQHPYFPRQRAYCLARGFQIRVFLVGWEVAIVQDLDDAIPLFVKLPLLQ